VNDRYEIGRRTILGLYILISTTPLFFLNMAGIDSLDERGYLTFAMLIWSSGFAFHYLSVLLPLPANRENFHYWTPLAKRLISLPGIVLLTFGGMYIVIRFANAKELPDWLEFVTCLVILAIGFWRSLSQAQRFHQSVNALTHFIQQNHPH